MFQEWVASSFELVFPLRVELIAAASFTMMDGIPMFIIAPEISPMRELFHKLIRHRKHFGGKQENLQGRLLRFRIFMAFSRMENPSFRRFPTRCAEIVEE